MAAVKKRRTATPFARPRPPFTQKSSLPFHPPSCILQSSSCSLQRQAVLKHAAEEEAGENKHLSGGNHGDASCFDRHYCGKF